MEETSKKMTVMGRLKKAVTNPFVMLGIAGLSYFGGLRQNSSSPDSFDHVRKAMGGVITHATLEGTNDSKAEYFSDGEYFRFFVKDTKGIETRMAMEEGGFGIMRISENTSEGISIKTMKTDSKGNWVPCILTKEQDKILEGKGVSASEKIKGKLTDGMGGVTIEHFKFLGTQKEGK